jgi:predicted DNA-binding protein (MmcQ/YjbR family)
MNIEEIRQYCLTKPFTEESFPFDEDTLVFKVGGKMFCLAGLSDGDRMNLKCDPLRAVELRERHTFITPGYHMNKRHWNTVIFKECDDDTFLKSLIDHSYELVRAALSAKVRKELFGE